MKNLIGAALVASAFMVACPASIDPAAAAAPEVKPHSAGVSGATDFSARRYYRGHDRYFYRPYDRPYYYARPYYYRPYPYSCRRRSRSALVSGRSGDEEKNGE